MKRTLIILLTLVCCWSSFGQSITLDKSFGTNGVIFYKNLYTGILKIIPLQNNTILVQGDCNNAENKQIGLLYKIDDEGKPDFVFGKNGELQDTSTIPFYSFLKVQPDGRIYLSGSGVHNNVTCFKPNGEKVQTFGKSGILSIDTIQNQTVFGTEQFASNNDNSIILGIHVSYKIFMAKFDSTGQTVKAFGDNGVLVLSDYERLFNLKKIFVLKDNSILCAGENYSDYKNHKMCLFKLHPDGQPDSSFGINGKTVCDIDSTGGTDMFFEPYEESACDVIELEDHRLLVSVVSTKANNDFIVRLLPDGSLDKSFGINGLSPAFSKIKEFTTLKDNSILVNVSTAVCLTPDGLPDKNIVIDPMLKDLDCLVSGEDGTVWAGTYVKDSTNQYLPALAKFVCNTGNAIPENTIQSGRIAVFPTVFRNTLNLHSQQEDILRVSLFNLQGKCLFTKIVNNKKATLSLNLPDDLYLCKIETSGGIFVQKVISKAMGQ